MENKGTIITAVLAAILKLSSLSLAQVVITPDSLLTQSNHIAAFFALLRDVDLNAETQNGYAITKTEYAQLKSVWKVLPPPDQQQLLDSDFWTGGCVKYLALCALLYALRSPPVAQKYDDPPNTLDRPPRFSILMSFSNGALMPR